MSYDGDAAEMTLSDALSESVPYLTLSFDYLLNSSALSLTW